MNRLLAEIIGGLVLCAALIGWWFAHNHKEELIGAQVCVRKYTITQAAAVQDNTEIEAAHAAELQRVVATYDSKLKALADRAGGLAEQLRQHDQLHARSLPDVAGSAGEICASAVDAATRRIEAEHAPSFEACLANQDELNLLRDAWIQAAQASK